MHNSIQQCIDHDMAIEVNTARPEQADLYFGVPTSIRQTLEEQRAGVYYRPKDSPYNVEEQKWEHMRTIAEKWKVPIQNTILLDDRKSTCRHVNRNGASAIHVHDENGITSREYRLLKKALKRVRCLPSHRSKKLL